MTKDLLKYFDMSYKKRVQLIQQQFQEKQIAKKVKRNTKKSSLFLPPPLPSNLPPGVVSILRHIAHKRRNK